MAELRILEDLGHRIRLVRQRRGCSQEDVALEAGLDRTYYSKVERGAINISAVNLTRIAATLRVPVGDFFPANAPRRPKTRSS